MLIDKTSLVATMYTDTDKNRAKLQYVLVTQEHAVATNGKILIQIDNPKHDERDHLNFKEKREKPVFVHRDVCKQMTAALPKKQSLPLRECGVVQKEGVIVSNKGQKITYKFEQDIPYPDYGKVIPNGKPTAEVYVDSTYLRQIADSMDKIQKYGGVKISIYEDKYKRLLPVKFEMEIKGERGRKVLALLMPMREKK